MGYLRKKDPHNVGGWKRRWFTLKGKSLVYYRRVCHVMTTCVRGWGGCGWGWVFRTLCKPHSLTSHSLTVNISLTQSHSSLFTLTLHPSPRTPSGSLITHITSHSSPSPLTPHSSHSPQEREELAEIDLKKVTHLKPPDPSGTPEAQCSFQISVPDRVYHLKAESPSEADSWIQALRHTQVYTHHEETLILYNEHNMTHIAM